jgi:hypothetical protein
MDRNALERFAERVAVSRASPEQHESATQNLGPIVASELSMCLGLPLGEADRKAALIDAGDRPAVLNSSAFPSITGVAASRPMSPNPSTAVPSEITCCP